MTALDTPPTLHVPDIDPDDDVLTAALKYARAGWYVGPLKAATKHPGSVLGKGWPTMTSRETDVIASWFAGAMEGTGLFLHVGRSGALVLDVDHPENLPDELEGMLDPDTRRPYQSTRPDCPGRGHYLFLQPDGRAIGNGVGKLGKGWGDVRGLNGVIVVAPTPHPDGGEYRWEKTGQLYPLPDVIVDQLQEASPSADAATDAQVQRFLAEHVRSDRPELLGGVLTRFRSAAQGGSRHGAMVEAACWAARESRAGLYPAKTAHDTLQSEFVGAMSTAGDGRTLSRAEALNEFAGVFAWAVAQANAVPDAELAERRTKAEERAPERPSLNGHSHKDEEREQEVGTTYVLPDEFWASRPVLGHIRQAAQARLTSPDVVLGSVLARLSASVPFNYELPGIRGGSATLNTFAVSVGSSGAGKSSGNKVASELLSMPADVIEAPLGSGEGLAELYMGEVEIEEGGKKLKKRQQVVHNVFIYVDEGAQMIDMMGRKGATLGESLRRAWSGETLGQSNATSDRTRHVKGGMYALGLFVGFQPEVAGHLLREMTHGTPQRFLWLSANDPHAPEEDVEWPGELERPVIPNSVAAEHRRMRNGFVRYTLGVDPEITGPLRDEQRRRLKGDLALDEFDSHRPLHMLKIAGLLAILDGRLDVDLDDWRLAGMVWETSCQVRARVIADVRRHEERAEERRVERIANREQASEAARRGAPKAIERIARKVAGWVHDAGEAGSTRTDIRSPLAGRDRHLFDSAVDLAIESGWMVERAERYYPGESKPADG
jgi:hypothetical protein